MTTKHRRPGAVAAVCPLREGFDCNLCHPEAKTGPQDCPTVAFVMEDDDMRRELAQRRAAWKSREREEPSVA